MLPSMMYQWHKWALVWKLMQNVTEPFNHTYDMVVKIRPDIKYFPQISTINLDEVAEDNYNLTKSEKLHQDPAQLLHNMSKTSSIQ